MAIETGLRTLLLAQAAITALVPNQTIAGNVYRGIFSEYPDQGILPPFIVITRTGFDPLECLDGTTGMEVSVFEIDCYTMNEPDGIVLARTVSDFLKDFSGAAGGSDTINAVHWENKRYDKIPLGSGLDARQHIQRLTFRFQHTAI